MKKQCCFISKIVKLVALLVAVIGVLYLFQDTIKELISAITGKDFKDDFDESLDDFDDDDFDDAVFNNDKSGREYVDINISDDEDEDTEEEEEDDN